MRTAQGGGEKSTNTPSKAPDAPLAGCVFVAVIGAAGKFQQLNVPRSSASTNTRRGRPAGMSQSVTRSKHNAQVSCSRVSNDALHLSFPAQEDGGG